MKRAFTLVETLVVVFILGVIAALLLPALAKARASADRVACRAHLRDLGAAFRMYLNESKDRLPRVNTMPSLVPPLNDAPPIAELLAPYVGGSREVFRCRADRITRPATGAPAGFGTYFDREGTSFQYDPMLAGLHAGEPLQKTPPYRDMGPTRMAVMQDYEWFHGRPGVPSARSTLFADGHVGDDEPRDVFIIGPIGPIEK